MSSETTRQAALDALKILDTLPEERFDRITRLAKELFGVETAAITLIDHDRQWFKSKVGLKLQETSRSDAFCDVTIRESINFTVPDASQDSRFHENPLVTGDPHIRFYAGYPLEASSGEHVGALCVFDSQPRIFTESEELLLRELALWVQKEMVIDNELDRAAQVQKGFTPHAPEESFGFDMAGGCIQARNLGGDFYDWYPVSEGHDLILADVMGKGMGAAILAATVRAVFRAGSRNNDIISSFQTAASILNGDLNNADSFVTLFYARLNKTSGLIRYVDAGHGLTIMIPRSGAIMRLTSENPPIGVGTDFSWQQDSCVLNPGDTLISVSDGVLELFDGTLRSLDGMAEIARGCSSAQEIVDTIIERAGQNPDDDVTVLVLRRNL